ncbi:MAG: hypothetical protein ACYC5O_22850 [Anaerolineae bacterium]
MLRKLIVLVVVVAVASLVVASAADITFPGGGASSAGEGTAYVGNIELSDIDWTLDSANPANYDYVRFTTSDVVPDEVYARAGASCTGSSDTCSWTAWTSCSNLGSNLWQCNFDPNGPADSLQSLQVAASQ